jgi:uncharacterized protein YjbI with pentapeptide repeats
VLSEAVLSEAVLSEAVLSEAVLSEAVLSEAVLSEAVLESREPKTLLIYGSKQSGPNREFRPSNRPSLCGVIRARARAPLR